MCGCVIYIVNGEFFKYCYCQCFLPADFWARYCAPFVYTNFGVRKLMMIFHFMPLIMCSRKTQGGIHPNVGLLARQDQLLSCRSCFLVLHFGGEQGTNGFSF